MKKNYKGFGIYFLLITAMLIAVALTMNPKDENESFGYKEFLNHLEQNKVEKVKITMYEEVPTGIAKVILKNKISYDFQVPNVSLIESDIRNKSVDVSRDYKLKSTNILLVWLPQFLLLGAVIILFFFIMNQAQGGGGGSRVMNFGKSRAKMIVDDKKRITFKNVAGLDEEKEELEELVEFLKSPRKFVELGARIPKGVLLVGPPGTGKTLLAKAVAGEAGVPFFSISGSDFVEMFVGVGASRVRDLFEQAKKNSPCMVFIDEIDAVGRKRGAGLGGGHDEREQTLNQLLVEMDGFGVNEGVIVVAATNRVDILDPALLRPGRFDRKVFVDRPDVKGREEILKVHAKGKPLSDDVDFKVVARTTVGFTGADLENLLNESAILAARENKKVIEQKDIQRAFIKVGMGTEKRSKVRTEKDNRITAYHEAGHAILMHILDEIGPVHMVSIIPVGQAGGWTMPLPEQDESYTTKEKLENEIIMALGGRAAEDIIFGQITTGAYGDIKHVTKNAKNMVTQFGMSDVLGPINFGSDDQEVFIGRDWGHTRNYGENIAGLIDSEIKRIVDTSFEEAKRILNENIDILHKTAELLLEKEKITREEFETLFDTDSNGKLEIEIKDNKDDKDDKDNKDDLI